MNLQRPIKPVKMTSLPQPRQTPVVCSIPVDLNKSQEYYARVGTRRTDAFTLCDYTAKMLAEQLTLMEQVELLLYFINAWMIYLW